MPNQQAQQELNQARQARAQAQRELQLARQERARAQQLQAQAQQALARAQEPARRAQREAQQVEAQARARLQERQMPQQPLPGQAPQLPGHAPQLPGHAPQLPGHSPQAPAPIKSKATLFFEFTEFFFAEAGRFFTYGFITAAACYVGTFLYENYLFQLMGEFLLGTFVSSMEIVVPAGYGLWAAAAVVAVFTAYQLIAHHFLYSHYEQKFNPEYEQVKTVKEILESVSFFATWIAPMAAYVGALYMGFSMTTGLLAAGAMSSIFGYYGTRQQQKLDVIHQCAINRERERADNLQLSIDDKVNIELRAKQALESLSSHTRYLEIFTKNIMPSLTFGALWYLGYGMIAGSIASASLSLATMGYWKKVDPILPRLLSIKQNFEIVAKPAQPLNGQPANDQFANEQAEDAQPANAQGANAPVVNAQPPAAANLGSVQAPASPPILPLAQHRANDRQRQAPVAQPYVTRSGREVRRRFNT